MEALADGKSMLGVAIVEARRQDPPSAQRHQVCKLLTDKTRLAVEQSWANLSPPSIPVRREKKGNFRSFSRGIGPSSGFSHHKTDGYGEIPYASEQGIFRGITANFPGASGIR
jgi:hypothetical protein